MSYKILAIAEVRDNQFRNVSFEAIAAGKSIANEAEVIAVLFGEDVAELAPELICYGADRVLLVQDEKLKNFTQEAYSEALLQIIDAEEPDLVIMGHTAIGRDFLPKVAMKKDAGLISDITKIEKDSDEVSFVRPIYAGKAFEERVIKEGMTFLTIRPNNIPALEKNEGASGEVSHFDVEIKDLKTKIKEIVRKSTTGVDLSEAQIVVSGGRGVRSKEGFDQLYELAEVLGAAVGASRGACDADYCDYSLQIGQTGKVVTPELYIAIGISGAIQHVAGMSNSKCIVAINKDPEATIFEIADYGIVADFQEVLPLLIEEFKQLKAGA